MKDLWIYFLTVILFKFCVVASEMVYQGYIYSIAIFSDLKMNVSCPKYSISYKSIYKCPFGDWSFGR